MKELKTYSGIVPEASTIAIFGASTLSLKLEELNC